MIEIRKQIGRVLPLSNLPVIQWENVVNTISKKKNKNKKIKKIKKK